MDFQISDCHIIHTVTTTTALHKLLYLKSQKVICNVWLIWSSCSPWVTFTPLFKLALSMMLSHWHTLINFISKNITVDSETFTFSALQKCWFTSPSPSTARQFSLCLVALSHSQPWGHPPQTPAQEIWALLRRHNPPMKTLAWPQWIRGRWNILMWSQGAVMSGWPTKHEKRDEDCALTCHCRQVAPSAQKPSGCLAMM